MLIGNCRKTGMRRHVLHVFAQGVILATNTEVVWPTATRRAASCVSCL